jgi:hypothetical protein
MKTIGAPNEWIDLIDSMVPDILELIVASWALMPAIVPDSREDPITEELCRLLRANRSSADLPFRIDIQMVELDPSPGEIQGRLDIAFSPMIPREDIYFCLECKRLSVPDGTTTRSFATEYVTRGMMRFIRGQYSKRVKHGGMLGYVFDGNVTSAFAAITAAIRARLSDLGMDSPGEMKKSSVRPHDSNCRETYHARGELGPFIIHHQVVPV